MPLYFGGSSSSWMMEPIGSSSGSAAAMPDCTATPAVVTMPLQYAVALNARCAPGAGRAEDSPNVARRAAYFESSIVASKNHTKAPAATTVTAVFRQKEPEMITG